MSGKLIRKLCNPSAERNKEPILQELKKVIPINEETNLFLEISSGSGQHVSYIAPHFPNIMFQPSEFDHTDFDSILAYIEDCPTKNICQPIFIDIATSYKNWGVPKTKFEPSLKIKSFTDLENKFDFILNINMIHISPFECTLGLFENAASLLKPNGFLFTYGPYGENGVITPESNVKFDRLLKQMSPGYGVRDLKDLKELANCFGIIFQYYNHMPANNKFVVWQKSQ